MAQRWDHRVASNVDQGDPTLWPMEGSGLGLRRIHPRVGRSNDSFSLPNYPDTRRRNTKKAIAGVLVVFGMFLTAGATLYAPKTREPIYEPHRWTWPGFSEDLRRRMAFRRTVRMPEASFVKLADLLCPAIRKNGALEVSIM